jgi:16S rRNA (uracil1498-N3)-methyltransferase
VTGVGDVVSAEVWSVRVVETQRPAVTLFQAVAKGDRMDDVVTKAVEIGVDAIVPFVAERTVVRWDAARRRKAHERWTAVARSAAKQCRSARLTTIGEVHDGPGRAFEYGEDVIVLHEGASAALRDALSGRRPEAIVVVVGPEGGLTPAESAALDAGGAAIVSLGDRILRTETAGLVAVTIVRYVYGSLG